MWECFNSVFSDAETHSLKNIGSETESFYVCVDNNDICVVMMDNATHDYELADEEAFYGNLPLYFTENSHRTSPVFRLYAFCEALREHPIFCKTSVYGLLITTSNILNEDRMTDIWNHLNITVRCVKEMRSTAIIDKTSELWESIAKYLTEKNLEDFVDISKYSKHLENKPEAEECSKQEEKTATAAPVRKLLRLEDIIDQSDPVFHTLNPDGSSSFVSANLPHIQVLPPIENATATLEQMIGLEGIKEHISKLRNLVLFKKKIESFPGIKCPDTSLHAIFSGAPGTGKTTVAQLYASLLKEAGILSKGNLLMANGRDAFMAKWVGSEEKNVRMALAAAKGNVLLIDEAYTLVRPNESDYARNILPLMLQLLANEEYRDIAVILCGYDSEMDYLLQSNAGLKSRFPNTFLFEGYSIEQLHTMAVNKIRHNGYILLKEASDKIKTLLQDMYDTRKDEWANGREVTNLYDRIIIKHADRAISSGLEGNMLITITAEDIPDLDKASQKTRKIGFR